MENYKENEEIPFKKALMESGVNHHQKEKLKKFEEDDRNIIRDQTLASLADSFEDIKKISDTEKVKMFKKMFDELRESYNIKVPNIEFVIGNNEEGNPSVYIITEKIKGTKIENFCDISDKEGFIKELDELHYNLARYIHNKYKNEEYYLNDIFSIRQYMFGKKEGDKKDHIYLIDTDPYAGNKFFGFLCDARDLSEKIVEMEKNIGNNTKFEKVRDEFKEFINSISRDFKKDIRSMSTKEINNELSTQRYLNEIKETLNL